MKEEDIPIKTSVFRNERLEGGDLEKNKPMKPPRPKKSLKIQSTVFVSHSSSDTDIPLLLSQLNSSMPRSGDNTDGGLPEHQQLKPIPKPKPRVSLVKAADMGNDFQSDLVESGNIKRAISFERALETVARADPVSKAVLEIQLVNNVSSSSKTEDANVEKVVRDSTREESIKPIRSAPPPPMPKPSKLKLHAAGIIQGIESPTVELTGVRMIEAKGTNGRRYSESNGALHSKSSLGSSSFRRFPLPSFLSKNDKSNVSSVFYPSPQRDDATNQSEAGAKITQDLTESNGKSTFDQRPPSEDVFATNDESSSQQPTGSETMPVHDRTSMVSRSSSNVSQVSSSASEAGYSPWIRENGFRMSLSSNHLMVPSGSTFEDLSPSPSVSADVSFEDIDEESKVKLIEERKSKAYRVAQEIVESEQTFVGVLKLLNQDFRLAVESARDGAGRPVLPDGVLNQILRYLPQLEVFNEDLLHDLQSRLSNWSEEPKIADIFVKKGAFLKMYTDYIRDYESMVALLDEYRQKNPAFDKCVSGFESRPSCLKLAVRHYMLKPIQRIPQYRLLLNDYRKRLTKDSPDYQNTQAALVIVSEVAEHANRNMKYLEVVKRLREIQSLLVGNFEVIQPGRILLKEGILNKLSRKEMQPRMFFLFNDVLLYTTPVGSGFKLNNLLPLSRMRVSKPTEEDFQNEFSIITTQRSFTISARTEQERTEWLTALEQAITETLQKRLSYNLGKFTTTQQVIKVEVDIKDLKIGMVAPVWIPDDRVSMCMLCKSEFTLAFRRHHCRGCGKVICRSCSDHRAPLRYLDCRPERVCSECFDTLERAVNKMADNEVVRVSSATNNSYQQFTKEDLRSLFRGFPVSRSKSLLKPAILSEVSANSKEVDASGYLKIWKNRSWKKMWFVIKDKVLYTYKASEDAAAEESTPLLGYDVQPLNTNFQGVEKEVVFELCHRGLPSIYFRTENQQSRDRWMAAMRLATVQW